MSHNYPKNSRYALSPSRRYVAPDGREVTYLAARTIPPPERHVPLARHPLEHPQRLELVAERYYGDVEQYWRICDANGVAWPPLATKRSVLVIPLPLEVGSRDDS